MRSFLEQAGTQFWVNIKNNFRKNERFTADMRMYQEIRNVHFLGNLECFVSLLTCVLRFASLPYHQRIVMKNVGFIYSPVRLVDSNCNEKCWIYLLSCKTCGLQYVRCTTDRF